MDRVHPRLDHERQIQYVRIYSSGPVFDIRMVAASKLLLDRTSMKIFAAAPAVQVGSLESGIGEHLVVANTGDRKY